MFGGLIVRLAISEGETATRSGQMSIPRYRPTIGFLQRSGSYHRRRLASLERRLKRLGCSPVGFGQRTFSRIVQQCLKKETDRVTFIAEYRDGSVARFEIDPWTLRNGHWVARIIARERQEQGSLKPGEIVRVYPDRRR